MTLPPDHPGNGSQADLSPQKPPRKRRKDAGQPRWEDRDYYILQWIGVQGVIRFDQLRRLLGRESPDLGDWEAILSESATRNAIDRWETGHLVNSAHVVPKEPKYYWLSNAGFQFVELDLPHYRPKRQEVPLLFACNQIRLYIELLARLDNQEFGDHWECEWISARMLAQRHPETGLHLPIAQFQTARSGTSPPPPCYRNWKPSVRNSGAQAFLWTISIPLMPMRSWCPLPLPSEQRRRIKSSDLVV